MYSYEEFRERFKEEFVKAVPDEVAQCVVFSTSTKVNVEMDTISIVEDMGQYKGGPCLYINDCYRHYKAGNTVEEEVRNVLEALKKAGERSFCLPNFSWEYMQDKVVVQLIGKKDNEKLLSSLPHRDYLDLAVIYRCVLEKSGDGITSCIVTNSLLSQAGKTEEDLHAAAYRNTPLIMMPRVYSMYEMLKGMAANIPVEDKERMDMFLECILTSNMQVVSNVMKQLGAGLMLYPDFFAGLGTGLQDLYIIPSSIHEVITLPVVEEGDTDTLIDMIRRVNATEILPEERLSDSLYRYIAKENRIVVV